MAINGRFNQTPPDKANELFERLLATSDNAVKTRERLIAELKSELELLAKLQEQHLFPILKRHGRQDLVQDATSDHEQTSALLSELERMPNNGGEFLHKVAELKRVFQQHLRNDKNELLPAVLKVLSEEEAGAVIEKVEDEMSSIDESKRAEERRTREQVKVVQQVTEDVANSMKAGVEGAQTMARVMQETVENSLGAVSDMTRRSTDQVMRLFGPPVGDAQNLTGQVSENLQAVTQSSTALAHGLQDLSREVFELSQKRLQRNLDNLNQIARCRSITDLMAAQSSLIRDNLEQTFDNSRRMAELTIQVADEVSRPVTVRAEQSAQRLSRAT